MELVVIVYVQSKALPSDEKFGLVSQMRRAVVSVASNFAEGYLKKSTKEKQHFMEMSFCSLMELDVQAEICCKVDYWSEDLYGIFVDKYSEVRYLLDRYREKIV